MPLSSLYGSSPKMRGFVVIVSVADIATFAALIPAAAQVPLVKTALGVAV